MKEINKYVDEISGREFPSYVGESDKKYWW